MSNCLKLAECNLREFAFKLIWNGKAMIDWQDAGIEDSQIIGNDPDAIAYMLYIMGREADAVCEYYGYEACQAPSYQELKKYFRAVALPWEFRAAVESISCALAYGSNRDYKPDENDDVGMIDIDTLLLKKN